MLKVTLVGVGRNLNRAIRTCHTFGVDTVEAVKCPGDVRGNLYSASDVAVERLDEMPDLSRAVLLEVDARVAVDGQAWDRVDRIVLGGESVTLPRVDCLARVGIATPRSLCLTVEGALAAALAIRGCTARPDWRMGWRHVGFGLWAGPLPTAREISGLAEAGVKSVVDLTRRDRPVVRRACERRGLVYVKSPMEYDADPDDAALRVAPPLAVHCFHGRDRTERFIDMWLERNT